MKLSWDRAKRAADKLYENLKRGEKEENKNTRDADVQNEKYQKG